MDMKKVVLITGASSGIGKETAKLFAGAGYKVYGVARRTDKMEDLRSAGVNIFAMDVTDDDSMQQGVQRIIDTEKRIDILVNNAGYGLYGSVEDVPQADARAQFNVNVFGLARLTQLILPYMRSQHSGKVVNISSIGGKITTPLGGWYYASKFAVEALSDSLRLEVKPFGIDVIIIEPGGIKTEWGGLAEDNLKKVSQNTAYKELVAKSKAIFDQADNGTEPYVIARLIKKAVEKKNPKPRYAKGHMARISLWGKRWLSDRLFDKIMMRILKMN